MKDKKLKDKSYYIRLFLWAEIGVRVSKKLDEDSHVNLDGRCKNTQKKYKLVVDETPTHYRAYSDGVLIAMAPKFYDEEGEFFSIHLWDSIQVLGG